MYLVTLFSAEYGDVDEVLPAETFDDAVAHVVEQLRGIDGLSVEVFQEGKIFGLTVTNRSETVLATVEDVPVIEHACQRPCGDQVVNAIESFERTGDASMFNALFSGGVVERERVGS